jgi:protein-tyrosine phosphatase
LPPSQSQLAFYEKDLIDSYFKAFGAENVCHVEVPDLHLVNASDLETTILPFLHESEERGLPVVVHCSGGSGRTGHVLAAWLARGRHLPAEQALDAVRATTRDPLEAVKQGNATDRDLILLVSGGQGSAGA